MKKIAFLTLLVNTLVACKAENPSLTTRPLPPIQKVSYAAGEVRADGLHQAINNQVDILFVLDDSDSMASHMQNVGDNIEKFANELSKIKSIDFHIAFTTVFDRDLVQVCPAGSDRAGQRNYDDAGTLGILKGDGAPNPDERRYVTREDNFVGILKATVNGSLIKKYIEQNDFTPNVCPQGAEREESTTPLLAVLENPVLAQTTNKGFRRKNAKFVAIIVSDATDAAVDNGWISLDQVYQRLMLATHSTEDHRNMRVFSVTVKPGSHLDVTAKTHVVNDGKNKCGVDPAFAESGKKIADPITRTMKSINHWVAKTITMKDSPLARLAEMTEDEGDQKVDQVLSICNPNYGSALALFGTRIQQDILQDLVVPLDKAPQLTPGRTPVTVSLGGVPLASDKWFYEQKNGLNQIVIPARGIDWSNLPANSEVLVKYTQVDLAKPTSKYWQ